MENVGNVCIFMHIMCDSVCPLTFVFWPSPTWSQGVNFFPERDIRSEGISIEWSGRGSHIYVWAGMNEL